MPDISDLWDLYLAQDVLEASRLIVDPHLLEGVVPVFPLIGVGIKVLVLPRETRASRVVHPDVKTCVCKKERHRLEAIAADAGA